jgi:hypothetical protein
LLLGWLIMSICCCPSLSSSSCCTRLLHFMKNAVSTVTLRILRWSNWHHCWG